MNVEWARTWIRGAVLLTLAGIIPACTSGGGSGASSQSADLPDTFGLVSPANGDQNISPLTGFSWQASPGAASYTLEVATDSGFSSFVIHQTELRDTSFTPATPLVPGTIYHWQVEAVNGIGSTLSLGAPWSFTTDSTVGAPGAFLLSSPANGGFLSGGAVTNSWLIWTASNGASSYTVEVASDSGFMNILLSQSGITGTNYAPAGVIVGPTYYWRVYAVDSAGSTLATNAPWSFQVDPIAVPGS